MSTDAEFQNSYYKLKNKFRQSSGKLFVPGGNGWYIITNVIDPFVEITQ